MKNLNLKAEIIRRFGTQGDFAKAIGWDQAKVSRVVNGWIPPEEDKITLSKSLELAIEEIWG